MEGVVTAVADKAEFKECLRLTWTQPYILQLVLSAGIGGLLFGYDTGNFYCRHDSLVTGCVSVREEYKCVFDDNHHNDGTSVNFAC
jgi:hypothetical protein